MSVISSKTCSHPSHPPHPSYVRVNYYEHSLAVRSGPRSVGGGVVEAGKRPKPAVQKDCVFVFEFMQDARLRVLSNLRQWATRKGFPSFCSDLRVACHNYIIYCRYEPCMPLACLGCRSACRSACRSPLKLTAVVVTLDLTGASTAARVCQG